MQMLMLTERKEEDMELKITCIPGDGIGPEIVAEARKVLDTVAKKYGHTIHYTDILMGGASIDAYGVPLTEEAVETAKSADAVQIGRASCRERVLRLV